MTEQIFRPLKHWVTINRATLPENHSKEKKIRYIDIGNVSDLGLQELPAEMLFGKAPSRARRIVQTGDSIISCVRTYLKAVSYIDQSLDGAIVSTGFATLTPGLDVEPRFLEFAIREDSFIGEVFSRSKGVNYPAITSTELGCLPISFPPLPEQRAIVAFLDAKLAQIDTFIANKRRLIELLLEQKQVIVNRYVTRGLNDGVELKDSGLDWLGQVPKHWEIKRAKYFFREVDERSESGTEEMLSVSHITGVTPRAEKNVTMFMSETNVGQKICQPDDVVINILWAWMGALGVARHHGIVSPAYGVYRQRGDLFEFGYLDELLRHKGYVGEYGVRSKGVTSSRARMYSDDFFDIPFPRPPLPEQRAIVARIEHETAAIARAVAQAEQEIKLIQEYRTTLISDAVTGKIDVRAWGGVSGEIVN